MSNLLPIIEQLADAKSQVERVAWLRSCPIAYLRQYDSTIRNRLMHAGCLVGIVYLDDMRIHMCATRDPDTGAFRPETQDAIEALGAMAQAWAVNRDGAASPVPETDHSITEL